MASVEFVTRVAIVNQKGGVGKTTITLGLAATAAMRGARVMVVDLDPQANATSGLGVSGVVRSVDDALASPQPGSIAQSIVYSAWERPPLRSIPRVAPSSPLMAQREMQLATDPVGAQDRLASALEGTEADLTLIDCPPSLGLLTINALFAATHTMIVTEPGAWASGGVDQILANLERVAARRNGLPELLGIAVNRLGRTRDAQYWHNELLATHGDDILPAVHQRAALTEAAAQSLPIHALTRPGAEEAWAELATLYDAMWDRISTATVISGVA